MTRTPSDGGGRWDLLGKGSLEAYFRTGRSILLAVDEPVHPHNERWIQTPVPRIVTGRLPAPGEEALVVVRAEYGEDRSLERLDVLHSDRPVSAGELRHLAANLVLDYGSNRSHRAVLFAVVHLGETASLHASKVVLPECCCPSSGPGEPCGTGPIAADRP